MLRRMAVLLWMATALGCPGESASQAAIVKPATVEAQKDLAAQPTGDVKIEAPGEENCCGAEGPSEVQLPAEDAVPATH